MSRVLHSIIHVRDVLVPKRRDSFDQNGITFVLNRHRSKMLWNINQNMIFRETAFESDVWKCRPLCSEFNVFHDNNCYNNNNNNNNSLFSQKLHLMPLFLKHWHDISVMASGVWNCHLNCLFHSLFSLTTKRTPKFRITGPFAKEICRSPADSPS